MARKHGGEEAVIQKTPLLYGLKFESANDVSIWFFLLNSLLTLRITPYNIFEIIKDSLVWTDIVHTRND